MSEFIVEVMPNKEETDKDRFMVKQKSTGWFYPNLSKIEAGMLYDKFNELTDKPLDLNTDFEKWAEKIKWLDKTSRRLVEIEEIYQAESDRILEEARANDVDFKKLYGGNNAATRKQYVDEHQHINELLEEKKELEFLKADDNRKISLIKRLIDMKIELIKYDK